MALVRNRKAALLWSGSVEVLMSFRKVERGFSYESADVPWGSRRTRMKRRWCGEAALMESNSGDAVVCLMRSNSGLSRRWVSPVFVGALVW